ncbi:MAG: hypothetical protein QG637_1306 [Chloroflexota bacterium]|nr:hypothetical protein [Chloroflexota bacterium]
MSIVRDVMAPEPEIVDIGGKLLREVVSNPSPVLVDLVRRGFEQKLTELYLLFRQGECSLGYLAEQLGTTPWETVRLLEARGWHTTNL